MLKCSSCLEFKTSDCFNKDTNKRGYSYTCKLCKKNNIKSKKEKVFIGNFKKCPKCKEYKELKYYYKCKNCNNGVRITCKKCDNNYYEENKEIILYKSKIYSYINKDIISYKKRIYFKENKSIIYNKRKFKIKNDPIFSLKISISKNINLKLKRFLKGNKERNTFEILGCTSEEFANYIESKFENWMNWNNRGLYNGDFNYGWDLDHIIPISSAKTDEEVYILNHYTNFRPLCSKINRDIKWKYIE